MVNKCQIPQRRPFSAKNKDSGAADWADRKSIDPDPPQTVDEPTEKIIDAARRHIFRDYVQRHLDAGHSPIGLYPCGKIVKGQDKTKLPIGWQRRSETPIAADDLLLFKADGTPELDASGRQKKAMRVDSILHYQPDADIGIAGGYGGACPIDVDTLDEELQQKIRAIFPDAEARRDPCPAGVGEGPCPSRKYLGKAVKTGVDKTGNDEFEYPVLVELIGPGRQTLVPPSMHPCGQPYRMADGSELIPPLAEWVTFGQAELAKLEAVLAPYMDRVSRAAATTFRQSATPATPVNSAFIVADIPEFVPEVVLRVCLTLGDPS